MTAEEIAQCTREELTKEIIRMASDDFPYVCKDFLSLAGNAMSAAKQCLANLNAINHSYARDAVTDLKAAMRHLAAFQSRINALNSIAAKIVANPSTAYDSFPTLNRHWDATLEAKDELLIAAEAFLTLHQN